MAAWSIRRSPRSFFFPADAISLFVSRNDMQFLAAFDVILIP
jgi:hypothetical protein